MAHINWTDENGKEKSLPVSEARHVFDFPESFPQMNKPGARLVSGTCTYYYDRRGNLCHYDNRGEE